METKELKKTFRDENIKTAGEIKAMVEKLTTRYVELDSKAFDIETKMNEIATLEEYKAMTSELEIYRKQMNILDAIIRELKETIGNIYF